MSFNRIERTVKLVFVIVRVKLRASKAELRLFRVRIRKDLSKFFFFSVRALCNNVSAAETR